MLIVMAGLPGTGKSTLAAHLAGALGGVVLSKDVVRAALFPPPVLDYSAAQDDVAMEAIYAAAATILDRRRQQPVILDGRTFSRAYQVERLLAVAAGMGLEPKVIECVCGDDEARARLVRDRAAGTHPAGNRTPDLYLSQKAAADPLTVPRLVVDTGTRPPDECLALCLVYLDRS